MGKSKYDNLFKSETIEKGYLERVIKTKKEIYYSSKELRLNEDLGTLEIYHDPSQWCSYFYDNINDPFFDCSIRLMESKQRRYLRARKKIEEIILNYENPIFITLTFDNDTLFKTSAETRRRYVARYLKEFCSGYVANIDFSPKKNREHYHAVIGARVDFSKWPYGFVFTEQIRTHDHDTRRISNYITKLTSHAFKVDATRLIYSRDLV